MYPTSSVLTRSPPPSVGAAALALLVLAAPVAADAASRSRLATGLHPDGAFDLHLAREDLDVDYADGSGGDALEITRLGVAFHEDLGGGVRGAIRAGGLALRQSGRAATAEADPEGGYVGLAFAGMWPAAGRLRFNPRVGWHYASADDTENGNETTIDWHALELRLSAVVELSHFLALRGGIAGTFIDGEERFELDDSTTVRADFDTEDALSGVLQLDFHTGDGGFVRFRVRGGNPRGAMIIFERNF